MELSIITPVYRNSSSLRRFLQDIANQENEDFELVFVIDTNTEGTLDVLDEFSELKAKSKIVFNSKRQGRTKAIKNCVKLAAGEYSVIVSVSNTFNSAFTDEAIEIAKQKQTDIIEFEAKFRHPKKFDGHLRKAFNKPVKIEDNPEIIALSYPFDFNKLYRTKLLKRIIDEPTLMEINSRFSLTIAYKALLMAETYSTVPKVLITSKAELTSNFNPLKLTRQWKEVSKYAEDKYEGKYNSELLYARYYHEVVFLFGFVGASKNKVLLQKLKKNFDISLKTDFAEFFNTNKYALRKTKETEIIIENRTASKLTKLFKDL